MHNSNTLLFIDDISLSLKFDPEYSFALGPILKSISTSFSGVSRVEIEDETVSILISRNPDKSKISQIYFLSLKALLFDNYLRSKCSNLYKFEYININKLSSKKDMVATDGFHPSENFYTIWSNKIAQKIKLV